MQDTPRITEESSEYRFPAQRQHAIDTLARLKAEIEVYNTPAMRALVRQWENRVHWFERKAYPARGKGRKPRVSQESPLQAASTPERQIPEIGLQALLPPL